MKIVDTCCFTGHRPNKLGGYELNNPMMEYIRTRLRKEILNAYKNGYKNFITGMVLGIDMEAAKIVLELKKQFPDVKLVCAIPFKGQEKVWPPNSQKKYQEILDKADNIVIISSRSYSVNKMQIRNIWMVDNSSLVITVWDGTKGGTFNCIKYAILAKHEPKIIRINPKNYKKGGLYV